MKAPLALVLGLAVFVTSSVRGGHTYEFIGAVWSSDQMPIAYCVDPSGPPVDSQGLPILTPERFAADVQEGFQTWQDASGGGITFVYTGICEGASSVIGDRINSVGWGWLWEDAIGLEDPSATHGAFAREGAFGQLYEADILVDVRFAESFDDMAFYVNFVLPAILLHEAGHFAGLAHSREVCSIMYPSLEKPGVPSPPPRGPSALCQDDIDGIRALYPVSP